MKEVDSKDALVVFDDKNIRRTWFNDEWWFSVVDVVEALTDSLDPKQYIKKMKARDEPLNENWGTICTPLETSTKGGIQMINCVSTKGAFGEFRI